MNAHPRFMSRRVLSFVFATLISILSFVPSKTVAGKIVDQATEKSLQNATVIVKGPIQTTTTNFAGWCTVTAPSPSLVLSIGYIGYGTREIKAGSRSWLFRDKQTLMVETGVKIFDSWCSVSRMNVCLVSA